MKFRVLKVTIIKNTSTYFPRSRNNIYYGVFFDEDEEHLALKCFGASIDGLIYFGTINRFIKKDIKVEELEKDYLFK